MPLSPEQQARLNELRAKKSGGNTLNFEQKQRLNSLRMKAAGNKVPDFAIPEGEREFDTGQPGGHMFSPHPSKMPIPQDEAEQWQTLSRPVIERELGGPFTFGKELEDFGARFDLSRSTNPDEMKLKLEDRYPQAEIKMLSGFGEQPVPVIRREGQPDFHAIDSSDKTMSDIADVFGTILTPEMATSIGTAILTRGMGTGSRIASQGGAGAAGDLIGSGIEEARGYQTDPFEEILKQAGVSGLFSMAGEYVGSKYGKPKGGLLDVPPGIQKIQEAQRAEKFAPLTAGDHSPVARLKEQQVLATNKAMQEAQKDKYRSVTDRLKQLSGDYNPDEVIMDDLELDKIVQQQVRELRDAIPGKAVEMRQGGKSIQEGIENFKSSSKKWKDAKYSKATGLSKGATFDISEVQDAVNQISKGVQAKGKDIASKKVSPILDERGQEIVSEVVEKGKGVQISSDPSGAYENLLKRVKEIDPNIDDFQGERAIEQIKTLRKEFGQFAEFGPQNPLPTSQQKDARKIYQMLSDVMDNPSGGSEGFNRAWKSAQESYKFRRKVLDAAAIKDLRNSKNIYTTGRKYATPGQFENLKLMKRTVGKDQWKKYQEAAKTDIYRDKNPARTIDLWDKDPDGFKMLFSPKDRAEIKAYAYSVEKLGRAPIAKALKKTDTDNARLLDIVKEGDDFTIDSIVKSAGGITSKKVNSIRQAVFKDILDKSSIMKEGESLIDPRKVITEIEKYEKSGLLKKVMLPANMQTIKNMKVYLSGIERGSDVGASLAGAEIASQFFDFLRPDRMLAGVAAISRNSILGRILNSPKVNTFLWGKGVRGEPKMLTRGIVIGLSNLASQNLTKAETSLGDMSVKKIKAE